MSINQEHKKEIDCMLNVGYENLNDAKTLLESGGYRSAVSRAYYVFLDIAKAALLKQGIIVKSHAGVVAKFSQYFIKNGIIKSDYGRLFSRALESRMEADYEVLRDFDKEETKEIISQAEEFLLEVKKKVLEK